MQRLKFHRAIVAIAMMLIGWLPSLAHDFEVDGIYYNLINDTKVEVTYEGSWGSGFYNEYNGSVVIPSLVEYGGFTYSVTSIGWDAFAYCDSLTSIEIPNSVTSIGEGAFAYCDSLTSIEIPDSVTSIGSSTFEGCKSLTSIEIPDSVTSIGWEAFKYCSSLTSIEIPNSVTSIGDYAFAYCKSLTSIEIPNSVTSIGSSTFEGCKSLTSIEIPDSVTSIGEGAFHDCTNLTSIEIPNSVTSIGYGAFSGCSSLTSIEIPDSVTSIGYGAFSGCSSLTSIEIPNSVTSIGDYAFYRCSNLTRIEIPNSVTNIGYATFNGCSSLTSVEIGNSVTSIGEYAFSNCSSLTSIEITNSVTSIGDRAFYECISLTSIVVDSGNTKYDSRNGCNAIIETASNTLIAGCQNTIIPNSVTSIGDRAFDGCSRLTSIEIPNSVTSIGDYAFYRCSNLTSIEIPNSITRIGGAAFCQCSSLTSVVIGNSVTSIGDNAFAYCFDLTSIEIGNSVTRIGDEAFEDCSSLISIEIPNSVTSIGESAFEGCKSLTSVEIPNSVTSIGERAFYNGEKLTIVVLGNSLTSIEKDAFKGCDNIKKIESKATKAPTIENEDQFSENVYANADLFVPIGYEDNYKYAYAWSEFHNIKGKDFSVKATSISLDKNEVSLKPTQTVVLTETIQPYDTSNKKVTWSSSDESVATIDANGLVTAIAVGEVTITATTTDGSNLSATCKVIVVPVLAMSIELDQTEASVEEKSDLQLTATILPEHTTNKEVAWSSSDKWVASVDYYGLVTMYSAGEVIITAATTDGTNLSATCRINVYSGIDGVNGDDVIVATVGDNIVVKNAKLGSVVNVYASNGALIASEEATDGSVVVEAPVKGVYVVKVGKQTVKVII